MCFKAFKQHDVCLQRNICSLILEVRSNKRQETGSCVRVISIDSCRVQHSVHPEIRFASRQSQLAS